MFMLMLSVYLFVSAEKGRHVSLVGGGMMFDFVITIGFLLLWLAVSEVKKVLELTYFGLIA